MKKLFVLVFLLFFSVNSYGSTKASRFAEKQYASQTKSAKAHIVVKKEHTSDYLTEIGGIKIMGITYGWGDMKIKGQKKFHISYLSLLNEDYNPFWSYVIPTK